MVTIERLRTCLFADIVPSMSLPLHSFMDLVRSQRELEKLQKTLRTLFPLSDSSFSNALSLSFICNWSARDEPPINIPSRVPLSIPIQLLFNGKRPPRSCYSIATWLPSIQHKSQPKIIFSRKFTCVWKNWIELFPSQSIHHHQTGPNSTECERTTKRGTH